MVALVVATRIVVRNRVRSDSSMAKGERSPSAAASSRTFQGHRVVMAVSAAARAAPPRNIMMARAR